MSVGMSLVFNANFYFALTAGSQKGSDIVKSTEFSSKSYAAVKVSSMSLVSFTPTRKRSAQQTFFCRTGLYSRNHRGLSQV